MSELKFNLVSICGCKESKQRLAKKHKLKSLIKIFFKRSIEILNMIRPKLSYFVLSLI